MINNKRKISISLAIILIISTAFLSFFIYRYAAIENKVEMSNNSMIANSLTFTNTALKYHNEDIKPINYLAGYKYEEVYDDIHFLTSIESWGEDRLKEVADELFANTHGDEMRYIEAVILDNSGGYSYSANQETSYVSYEIPISFYDMFPVKNTFYNTYKKSYITIYGIEDFTYLEDFAQPLSVAYGLHFVRYYMEIDGTEKDKNTEYFRLRAEDNDKIRFGISNQEEFEDYKNNYMWYLIEIAANDYMYLMGSENAHRIIGDDKNEAEDRKKYYKENDIEIGYKRNIYSRNIIPHTNVELELPDEVAGLPEYFYGLINQELPEFNPTKIDLSKADFRMSKDRNKWLIYEWEEPFGEGAVYRVIIYDGFDKIITVGSASRSNVSNTPGYQLYLKYYKKNLYYEELGASVIKARLSVVFPDGSIYLTDPIVLEFEKDWED